MSPPSRWSVFEFFCLPWLNCGQFLSFLVYSSPSLIQWAKVFEAEKGKFSHVSKRDLGDIIVGPVIPHVALDKLAGRELTSERALSQGPSRPQRWPRATSLTPALLCWPPSLQAGSSTPIARQAESHLQLFPPETKDGNFFHVKHKFYIHHQLRVPIWWILELAILFLLGL